MAETLQKALQYASHGLRVLALSSLSKVPLAGGHGCNDATTDATLIRRWWRDEPTANVGIVPGPRYWVLDADTKAPKGHLEGISGMEAIQRLDDDGYRLPETTACRTPRGGVHFWFEAPAGITIRPRSTGMLVLGEWAGLDIRSVGSYVVAPPSRILIQDGDYAGAIRGYEWFDTKTRPKPTPDWLLEILACQERPVEPERQDVPFLGDSDKAARWAAKVLETSCATIAATASGRHHTWLRHARLVGGYVGGGHLGLDEARTRLEEAARRSLRADERREREIRKTIGDGLASGCQAPCHPPEMER